MENKTYYQNNVYFGKYIDKYFRNYNNKNLNLYDSDYYNPRCPSCKIVSQFQNINYLGNKKLQYQNLKKFYNKVPDYVPITYSFKSNKFAHLRTIFTPNKLFIVKPEDSLRKKGVSVVSSFMELQNWISNNSTFKNWIIQEFISDCLLINNKKFHLCIYAIVIKNEKHLKTYVYSKGFIYTSKNNYNVNKYKNTNVSLSGGNSFNQVKLFPEDFLDKFGIEKYNLIEKQIDNITNQTILACHKNLECDNNKINNYKCYKLLKYDVIVDNNYKVWLLETNARVIAFVHPPPNYLKNMYFSILNLVINGNTNNFRKVLDMKLNYNLENFTNNKDIVMLNKYNQYFFIFIIICIFILYFY